MSSSILTFPIRSAIARSISAYRGAMGCLEPGGGIDVGTSSRRYEDWTEAGEVYSSRHAWNGGRRLHERTAPADIRSAEAT